MISTEARFGDLCRADKLRLQKLIQELAKSSKEVGEKQKQIDALQNILEENTKQKGLIEAERTGAFHFIGRMTAQHFL